MGTITLQDAIQRGIIIKMVKSGQFSRRAFTLIELLVVIAIVGVLSAIVMTSLGDARTRGADASIKSNLASIRAQAELYYSNNNDYGTQANSCTTAGSMFMADPKILEARQAIEAAAGATASCRSGPNPTNSWAISVQLKGGTANAYYWCVDSTGIAKARTQAQGNVTAPPSSVGGGC